MVVVATKMRQALGGAEFSGSEHKERIGMVTNYPTKMDTALAVDRLFKDYLLEFTPAEAIGFISRAHELRSGTHPKILSLLHGINDLIPPSAVVKSGPGHTFRIGQRINRRIVYLTLSGVHFPRRYRYSSLMTVLEKYAKEADALYQPGADEGDWEVMFWWL